MAPMGERVLIVGPAWVGDMVMAQSLYKLLKQREPECSIDVLAPAWSSPLLARMTEVNRAIEVPIGHGEFGLATRYHIGKKLRTKNYDRAIVLPRSLKAALIPFFAQAKRRSGYRGEMRYGLINDMRELDKSVLTKTVERYLALGMEEEELLPPSNFPEPQLQCDEENIEKLVSRFSLQREGSVALLPGAAYGPAKQWPIAHWAVLSRRLVESGREVWILGSQKDKTDAEAIIKQSGVSKGIKNLCGNTNLVDAVDLLRLCEASVSNDSGLMHVAAAVGIPVVGIYGSSTPDYTPPLTQKGRVVYQRLECSPCFKRECPLGHTECLTGISAEEVWQELNEKVLN